VVSTSWSPTGCTSRQVKNAGTVQLRTYHHESRREIDGYRGDPPGPKASPKVAVTVRDADGAGWQITDSLHLSVGQEVGNSTLPSHTEFTFRANGRDAVTIQFAGEKGRLWLNGLELQEQMNLADAGTANKCKDAVG
jgi:hypothetical protein